MKKELRTCTCTCRPTCIRVCRHPIHPKCFYFYFIFYCRIAKCSHFILATQNIKFYRFVTKIKKFLLPIWWYNRGLFPLGNKFLGVFILNLSTYMYQSPLYRKKKSIGYKMLFHQMLECVHFKVKWLQAKHFIFKLMCTTLERWQAWELSVLKFHPDSRKWAVGIAAMFMTLENM